MNAIECRDLTKSYQGFTLDHITFTLPAGCILGLVGENGAGKSTTLKLLMNATSREDGQVSLLGKPGLSPDQAGHRGGAGRGLPARGHHPLGAG